LEEVVKMGSVFPVVELAAGVADLIAVGVVVLFKDVACLEGVIADN
jgi:hypothetical protein